MKKIPSISEAEWEIMKVFWSKAPSTANEVVQSLMGNKEWKPNTIKTLISRLVTKNALGYKEDGRSYLYFPLVTEDECRKAESRSFLNKIYGGSLTPMLLNFLQEEKLSEQDIEELKRILNEKTK
jgi:BlaI family penicillinase repressor